jgi:sulfatase maturation enzyme AslB (radical SAM superfamily)
MKCLAFKGLVAKFDPVGRIGLCCNDPVQQDRPDQLFVDNRQRMHYIQQQNYTGFDFCDICHHTEAAGDISTRMGLDQTPNHYSLTINVGNKCNLRCLMCRPEYSSLLSDDISQLPDHLKSFYKIKKLKSFSIHISQRERIQRFIQTIDMPLNVNIQGGEPLYDDSIVEWLQQLLRDYPIETMNLSTNLTYNTRKTKQFIEHPAVRINASIDGFADSYEWTRWNASWHRITDNLRQFQSICTNRLSVHTVLHAVSILGQAQLADYLTDLGITQERFTLTDPEFLQLNVLLPAERERLSLPLLDCNLQNRVLFWDYMTSLERSRGQQMPESISKFFDTTGK